MPPGRGAGASRAFRLEHLRMIGWQLFAKAQVVQWCGHDHHFLVVPDADRERPCWCRTWGRQRDISGT